MGDSGKNDAVHVRENCGKRFSLARRLVRQAPPDLSRALYAFHALCDLLFITDVGWVIETAAVRRRRAAPEQ